MQLVQLALSWRLLRRSFLFQGFPPALARQHEQCWEETQVRWRGWFAEGSKASEAAHHMPSDGICRFVVPWT